MGLAHVNLYASDGQTATAGVGDEYQEGGNYWKYVKANGAIAAYAAVALDAAGEATEVTSTISGARPTAIGIAQFAFADNDYGWVLVGPFGKRHDGTEFKVLTSAASAVDVIMYTSATAGKVDDGDGSGDKIAGLVLTESGAAGAGTFKCQATQRMVTNCGA